MVLATDVLPPVEFGNFRYVPGIDPEIETFELIAIYPVECVNLSIYRRKKRQALKARFCNNRVTYFELGGFEKRGVSIENYNDYPPLNNIHSLFILTEKIAIVFVSLL